MSIIGYMYKYNMVPAYEKWKSLSRVQLFATP